MATFTVRPEGIIRQPALTMPGNATGSEAACTSLTASQIRTLLSLGTTSDVTFDIVRATTSVQTPLVNNASAALTLGNATYGVTVPGAMGVGGANTGGKQFEVNGTGDIYLRGLAPGVHFRVSSTSQAACEYYSDKLRLGTFDGTWREAFTIAKSAPADSLVISSTGAATFSGDISMSKTSAQGYVYSYAPTGGYYIRMYQDDSGPNGYLNNSFGSIYLTSGTGIAGMLKSGSQNYWRIYDSAVAKYLQSTHDGTNGILSTSSGNLNLTPTGGTVAVTGGITASGVVSHGAYTVATLPAAGSNAGKMAQVTDSNVAASGNYGATVAAGGANRVKVFSDGTNWVIA